MNRFLFTIAVVTAICFTACAQKTERQNMGNKTKTLVAYFSATGTTERVARSIAGATGGTLYAIVPQDAYTHADLDWNDSRSRSSVEMNNADARPSLKQQHADLSGYGVVFIGFPIWWNEAPRIINTFIESNDLSGKILVPFATSGGSGISHSVEMLRKTYPDLDWKDGKLLNGEAVANIEEWANGIVESRR